MRAGRIKKMRKNRKKFRSSFSSDLSSFFEKRGGNQLQPDCGKQHEETSGYSTYSMARFLFL